MKLNEALIMLDKQENLDMFIEHVIRDCKSFLNAKKPGEVVYSGRKQSGANFLYNHPVRKNRKPLHTPQIVHETIDDWMKEKFDHRFRSDAIFVTGFYSAAEAYGDVYSIYPIGDFNFLWSSEIDDLYNDIISILRSKLGISLLDIKSINNPSSKAKVNAALNKLDDELEELNYQDTNLSAGIDSGNEIMIISDSYHAVKVERGEALKIDKKIYESV